MGEIAGFVWVCAIGKSDSKSEDDAEIWCGDHA
jgi:hypothetical protein